MAWASGVVPMALTRSSMTFPGLKLTTNFSGTSTCLPVRGFRAFLAALGRTRQEAAASIRFGLGRATSAAEITLAIATVREAIHELRA